VEQARIPEHPGLAGTAAFLGLRPEISRAEPPPETTRLRIPSNASVCRSPEWIAEELLHAEVSRMCSISGGWGTLGWNVPWSPGDADIAGTLAAPVILRIEAGDPIVMLAGEHIG